MSIWEKIQNLWKQTIDTISDLDPKWAFKWILQETKEWLDKQAETRKMLAEDIFEKDKWFWNDLNNVFALTISVIPLIWTSYAEQTVIKNIWEDIEKKEQEKRKEKWKKEDEIWPDLISEDTYQEFKPQIQRLEEIYWKQKVKQIFEQEKREKKVEYQTFQELKEKLGKWLEEYVKKWLIDNSEATQAFQIVAKHMRNLNSLLDNLKQTKWVWADWVKNQIKEIEELKDKYYETLLKKIEEYATHKNKWEAISNDDELYEIMTELQSRLNAIRVVAPASDVLSPETWKDPLMLWKKWFQTATSLPVMILKTAQLGLSNLYNKTWWKLTDTHLELQGWPQTELDQITMSTSQKIFDKVWNFIDSVAPYLVWAWWQIKLTNKFADKVFKNNTVLRQAFKAWTTNEVINSMFNVAFEPILSPSTARFDVALDAFSAIFLSPLLGAVSKWIKYWLEKHAIQKYWDLAIEITDDTGKVKKTIKLADLATNEDELKKIIDTFVEWKSAKDIAKLAWLFGENVKRMDKIAQKKSWIITNRLVRAYKENVIDWIIKWFEKTWQKNVANALRKLKSSAGGVDEIFKALQESFAKFANELEKAAKVLEWTNEFAAIKARIGEIFMKQIGESLAKNWKIIPENIRLPSREEMVLKYLGNNVSSWKKLLGWLDTAVDVVMREFRENKWKPLTISRFINTLINVLDKYFDEPIKNIRGAKVARNIKEWLERFKKTWWYVKFENIPTLWQTVKHTITINALKDLFKNPIDFYIVLFHELTHKVWGVELFRKIVGEQAYKEFSELYDTLKLWVAKMKQIPGVDVDILTRIENTVLKNKEEFFAYILGEMFVKWRSDVLEKMINLLKSMWLPVDIQKFLKAIRKYINTRFDAVKWNIDKIKQMKDFGETHQKARLAFNTLFSDFLKRGDYTALYRLLDETELETLLNALYTPEVKKYIKSLWLSEDIIKDAIKFQIMMSAEWIKGFQAWMLWKYIGDIINDWTSVLEDYVVKIFGKDKITDIKKALRWEQGLKWVMTDTISDIVKNMLKANTVESRDKVNLASLIFSYWIQWFGLKKSQKDLIKEVIDMYKKEFEIIDEYITRYDEFLKWLGLKINKDVDTTLLKQALEDGDYNALDKLLKKEQIVLEKIPLNEVYIRDLYNKFNHNIVHTVLKRHFEKFGVSDDIKKLNERLYAYRQAILSELENKWIKPAQKIIWWANKLWAYLFEKVGKKVIIKSTDWRHFILEWGVLKEWGYAQTRKIAEEGFMFDRDAKFNRLIPEIYNTNTFEFVEEFTSKIKICLS